MTEKIKNEIMQKNVQIPFEINDPLKNHLSKTQLYSCLGISYYFFPIIELILKKMGVRIPMKVGHTPEFNRSKNTFSKVTKVFQILCFPCRSLKMIMQNLNIIVNFPR